MTYHRNDIIIISSSRDGKPWNDVKWDHVRKYFCVLARCVRARSLNITCLSRSRKHVRSQINVVKIVNIFTSCLRHSRFSYIRFYKHIYRAVYCYSVYKKIHILIIVCHLHRIQWINRIVKTTIAFYPI